MRRSASTLGFCIRILITSLPLVGVGPIAAADTPAIPEVTIDLNTQSISGVIPFGIPFAFTGNVPANVKQITTSYLKCEKSTCSEVGTTSGCTIPIDNRWKTIGTVSVQNVFAAGSNGLRPFHINVPKGVEPNAYYAFRFEIEAIPDQPSTTKFQQSVRDAVAKTALKATSGDITADQLKAMQNDLDTTIKRAAGPCARITAPEALFGPDAQRLMRHAIQNNLKVAGILKQYADDESDLELHLRAVTASPLGKLFAALHVQPTKDATLSDQTDNADVIRFARLAPFEITALANGADPANITTKLPLDDIATDAEFSLRATSYMATAHILSRLRTWMAVLLAPQAGIDQLISTGLLTSGDKASLVTLFAPNGEADRAEASAVGIAGTMTDAATRVNNRDRLLHTASQQVSFAGLSSAVIEGSTLGTFETFAGYYVSGDAGFAVILEIHKTLPYLGTNFYLVPVNRNVSLTQDGAWPRRIAFTLGVTLSTIEDAQKVRRSDLFGNQSLVIGVGVRITDVFRISAGGIIFNRKNPDPLVKKDRFAATPYFALSFDVNLARTFAGLGKLFP